MTPFWKKAPEAVKTLLIETHRGLLDRIRLLDDPYEIVEETLRYVNDIKEDDATLRQDLRDYVADLKVFLNNLNLKLEREGWRELTRLFDKIEERID